ncbi:hypothetical protein [Desulfosarcina ovata]|uniref:Tyr recombinase domain-containing protein n=1 Tax=Desulfosarcina ovata subsp. ovata TaxID=2752305 RepID=A0A5K8A7B1_9BACT|nr:hypothetical protein [Desulfosarcina ovata]BBO88254.1 hypothetical protein DSCOOX_14340 [Desulfosarcina ovata subsp. ovata]
MLESPPGDYLLFVLRINNDLRVGDLLTLTVGDLRHLKPGEEITIVENKTGKRATFSWSTILSAMRI